MNSTLYSVLYGLFAAVFALAGLALLFFPEATFESVDLPDSAGQSSLGLGFLLVAALNLYSLLNKNVRQVNHWLVFLYITAVAAIFGLPSAQSWWLWLPAALLLLLPLVQLAGQAFSRSNANTDELVGEVKWFNPRKGFGFIITADESEYFVHFKAVQNGGRHSLRNGTQVRFQTLATERGEQAVDVFIQ